METNRPIGQHLCGKCAGDLGLIGNDVPGVSGPAFCERCRKFKALKMYLGWRLKEQLKLKFTHWRKVGYGSRFDFA